VEKLRLYEAMFLVDSALGGAEFPGVIQEITAIVKRHGAEIRQIQRWAERKLAYEVKGLKRGLYILVHFEAPPDSIAEMRRDIYLTEKLVRVIILAVSQIPEATGELFSENGEHMEKPEPEPEPEVSEPEPEASEADETQPETTPSADAESVTAAISEETAEEPPDDNKEE